MPHATALAHETPREIRRLLAGGRGRGIRPGRFDGHIRIDLPDAEARRAIFEAELKDRPATDPIELDGLVTRTEGMTPAAIAKIVDTAAPT